MENQLMFFVISSLFIFVLSALCYCIFFKDKVEGTLSDGSSKDMGRRLVILFIDAPDPDNPASASAIAKHILRTESSDKEPDSHLHIVLTGRPVDLKTAKATKGALLLEDLLRHEWEENNPLHSQRVLEDAAARLEHYLGKCNIKPSMVTIYHGGVAPCAPLSDQAHDWDFLFDRRDLITKQEVNQGDIVSPKEYQQLVERYNGLSGTDRADQVLNLLRTYPLVPLSALKDKMKEKESYFEILVYLGGPATALVQLFEGKSMEKLRRRVVELYAMFGALSPGRGTLLPNQFNVACDLDSACKLFIDNLFPSADKYLITTETSKSSVLRVSSGELKQLGINPYIVDLQLLWESVHNGRPQPLFDVIPVMVSLGDLKNQFQWGRKKAVLRELEKEGEISKQTFHFSDSDDPRHVLVSAPEVQASTRDTFLNFLQKTWS